MVQYIYGKNAVIQRIKSKHSITKLYLTKQNFNTLQALIQKDKLSYEIVSSQRLDQMVRGVHQGLVAAIEPYALQDLETVVNRLDLTTEDHILVLCDQLEDPHNLGAILRTADAVGVAAVIIGKHRSIGLTPTVAKVSTGAIETVPVCEVTNLAKACDYLKQKGFWIIGADNDETVDYRKMPKDRNVVLVVGSEGRGISNLVKKQCDYLVKIPMVGVVSSLNVSVATGILLYELVRDK